jgi:UDP-glucose 4-epimerase
MNVLVTGGLGFIGSHTVVELFKSGHSVVIIDNLCNSSISVLQRLQHITAETIPFVEADVRHTDVITGILQEKEIDVIIHFAALKAVGESTQKPLEYYDNNIGGLVSVLTAMQNASVNKLIFSSSATVYGNPDTLPLTEDAPLKPATNPYGATKQMGEHIIEDTTNASDMRAVLLRYFNPIGAHESGLIGEAPNGVPNNLVPYLVQVASGVRDKLTVFGDDYDTADGSGVRDYIHVVDLARAHVSALDYVVKQNSPTSVFNIGTGRGASVLELISTFERVNNVKVPYEIGPRRPGDVACVYADPSKAEKLLSWKAEKSLDDSLRDAWHWQTSLVRRSLD